MSTSEETGFIDAEQAFASDVASTVERLRNAIARTLEGIPNLVGQSATELSRNLSLGGKLGWKIHWLLTHRDPVAASAYVPGRAGLQSLTSGLRAAGALEAEVVAVERAATDFLKCVDRTADDRQGFDTLVASIASEEKFAVECRKLAHQGARFVWGIETDLYAVTEVVRPTDDVAQRLDVAVVRGLIGCQRLRSNVPIRLALSFNYPNVGDDDATRVHRSIDALSGKNVKQGGLPIMQSYSSGKLPSFTECRGTPGLKEYRLGPGPIGREGRFDLVTGEYIRGGLVQEDTPLPGLDSEMRLRLRVPAKLTVFDAIVHRDVFGRPPSAARLLNDLYQRDPGPHDQDDEMDAPKLEILRATARDLALREAPRFADAVMETVNTLGWQASEFDVYRIRMAYAPIPTTLAILFGAARESR